MMKFRYFVLAVGILAGVILSLANNLEPRRAAGQDAPAKKTGRPVASQPAKEPKEAVASGGADVQVDMSDPAFEKFVDLSLLAPAIDLHNAGMLTDIALQLAFAESILERQHKFTSAKEVAALAIAAAVETQDKASLERLAKLAAKTNDAQMTTKISVAKLQAGKTRAPASPTMVAADSIKECTIENFHDIVGDIQTFKILANRTELENIKKQFEKQNALPKELRDKGIFLANEALKALPKGAEPSPLALAMQKMVGSKSRQAVGTKALKGTRIPALQGEFRFVTSPERGLKVVSLSHQRMLVEGVREGDIIVEIDGEDATFDVARSLVNGKAEFVVARKVGGPDLIFTIPITVGSSGGGNPGWNNNPGGGNPGWNNNPGGGNPGWGNKPGWGNNPGGGINYDTGIKINTSYTNSVPTRSLFGNPIMLRPRHRVCTNPTCPESQHRID